ncbi:hypothetical protein HpHA225_09040 [Helicobacter pylori]
MDFTTLQNDFTNDYQKALIANAEFLEAKKYYNGNQLPQDVLNIILERGQTPIVENMFKVIVNKILGYKIESISEIRLSPKQEEDRALSDLLNSLLQVFIQQENYDIKALDLGDDLIKKAQDHSGIINQVKLLINHKTGGLKGVDYDLAKTDNARLSYANRVAKTMAQGGQVTQKLRDEAKAMTSWGFRSKEENTARATQTQEILLNSLRKNLQMLESLGGSVSPLMLAKIKEHQDKADYINETSGKIDLKKYQSLTKGL